MAGIFKGPQLPQMPQPIKPPPLPDLNSPEALAAKRLEMQKANASGRSATMLTTPASGTIAGGGMPAYAGTTLAQR